jgi:gliding motility-associated-like protein
MFLKKLLLSLLCLLLLKNAGAQPLRSWWNGDYKCIARDTGLELSPWKLQYPANINLIGETNAAYFDENDSLQFFFPSGGTLYKRTDSVIFKPSNGDNQSCLQSALCYFDKSTDTIYFIGKPLGKGPSYLHTLSIIKIHPNKTEYSVFSFDNIDNLDESMCAMKFNNGKIWTVVRKIESDEFLSIELRSLTQISSKIPHSQDFQSLISALKFHPTGKLLFYSDFLEGGGREHFLRKSLCLNFDPKSGQIGFRKILNYPGEIASSPSFDSSGKIVYLFTIQRDNYLESISQLPLEDWLNYETKNMVLLLKGENLINSTVRFISATNNKIYFNVGNIGYGVINNPELLGDACNIKLVEVKNRVNSFDGWQEAVPEQIKVPNDTFTFFSVPYPLNTKIGIPNTFTPNDDLLNDAFFITLNPLVNISDFNVRIFSRWGVEVFQSEDPHFNWEGTFNNKPVPEGTYYYFITLDNVTTGNSETHKGPLFLMR